MSQHPSLLGSQKGKQHRSVSKRYERLKHLIEKNKWDEKTDSVYGLPKIKSIKFKVKKEKAAAPAAEEAAAATTATAGAQPQAVPPQAKTAAAKPAGAEQKKEKKAK